jgi:hypothetical protein
MSTIAAGQVSHLIGLLLSGPFSKSGLQPIVQESQVEQFRFAFNINVERLELLNKHFLMEVLRKNQCVRITTEASAKIAKGEFGDRFSSHPEIARTGLNSSFQRYLINSQLPVKLKISRIRPGLAKSCRNRLPCQ